MLDSKKGLQMTEDAGRCRKGLTRAVHGPMLSSALLLHTQMVILLEGLGKSCPTSNSAQATSRDAGHGRRSGGS